MSGIRQTRIPGEGRDKRGRFTTGNTYRRTGVGNKANEWRAEMEDAIEEGNTKAIFKKLIEAALAGRPWAVREFNDRVYGKATQRMDLKTSGTGFAEMLADLELSQRQAQAPAPSGAAPIDLPDDTDPPNGPSAEGEF